MLKLSFISMSLKASIKNKLILMMIVFNTIPFFIFAIYTYFNSQSEITKELIYAGNVSLNKCTGLINNELEKYVQKCNNIISNGDNGDIIDKLKIDYGSDLVEKVLFYNSVNIFINNMQLFDSHGKDMITFYISNKSLYENKFFKFLDNAQNKAFITNNVLNVKSSSENIWFTGIGIETSGEKNIYLYRSLLNETENATALEIKVPFSDIAFYMRNMDIPKNSLVIYADANNNMVYCEGYCSGNESVQPENINLNDYIVLENKLINSHKIAVAISKNEVGKRVFDSLSVIIPISIFAVFCMIIASVLTSKRITVKLEQFIDTINNDNDCLSNFNSVNVTGNDEVSFIKRKFKELAQTINSLNAENMEVLKKSNKLEIDLLQSKINPHLLYNSLSAIKWTAQRRNDKNTVKVVDSLTKYYRRVLNREDNVIKIKDELSMISEYVNIMSYSNATEYKLELYVDENILECNTIKLILQPILENAVLHGLSGKEGEKRIIIKGRAIGNYIELSVEDNGYGMDENTIRKVLGLVYQNSYGGYGMKNLINRIKMFYGEESKINIESELDRYTKISLLLPELDKRQDTL